MNEQIKQLATQAGLDAKEIRDDESLALYAFEEFDIELFAELVRQDERDNTATELRRLHEVNQELLEALEWIRKRIQRSGK